MAKILFFNPPSREQVYLKTNVSIAAPSYPNLTLATLAGHLIKNHEVKIVDLDLSKNIRNDLLLSIKEFRPDLVATSAKTPDYFAARNLIKDVKKKFPKIRTVIGGVHITSRPEEVCGETCFDAIVLGEADTVLPELLANWKEGIGGVIMRKNGKLVPSNKRRLIKDLNKLPFPAWHLFNLKKYKNTRLYSRKNPCGHIETSRGCSFNCNFCNKLTFGRQYRTKEPKRVVDEIEYMLRCGFQEIHFADDSFTQDINRAKEVCREILRRNLKFPWDLSNGIRVNLVDEEFFRLAKKAGLWQVGFGIESGDQAVLDQVGKGITLGQVEKAVKLAHKYDIDTFGFFILALSGETEKSIQRTIEFAKKLPLDTAKFDICIPYPGTRYYNELKKSGKIKNEYWPNYICHQTEKPLFEHENLTWETISCYYKRAFREFYLRPTYILRRLLRSIKKGDLFYDFVYFLNAKW